MFPLVGNGQFPTEVLPDDAILDAPSLVTPLLLKKASKWIPDSTDRDSLRINRKSVDQYIKLTTIASLTHTKTNTLSQILCLDDYYASSAGELLFAIGLSRVREYTLQSDVKKLSRTISKGGDGVPELEARLDSTEKELSQTQSTNKAYKSDEILRCSQCPFKTESSIVMSGHYEVPHFEKRMHQCNWCCFSCKEPNLIIYHNLIEHKRRVRIEREQSTHCCRFCQFECKGKRKLVSHLNKCERLFPHHNFLSPGDYGQYDYPAVTSKLITQEDVSAYEQALKTLRLAAYNPHQLKISTGSQKHNGAQPPLVAIAGQSTHNNNTYILHLISTQSGNRSTGILQHPKQTQSCFMNGKTVVRTASDIIMAPQDINSQSTSLDNSESTDRPQSSSPSPPKGSTFVICEICDSYIKDLSQLKLHMEALHKVSFFLYKIVDSRFLQPSFNTLETLPNTSGANTSQDFGIQTTFELPKMPMAFFYRSRIRETLIGCSLLGNN